MEGLNLVQYNSSYAKSIAEMWKKSSEGWNGGFADATEESVLKGLEASTSINIYLAEKGGEILGLCDFSQYLEDEGALYIKLLNVRYDYHGQGIGRTLVCKSIIRTEELGWTRLDLYTWPGNTKSIPLYKRCGFFLEDRDDTTHLMNFIPYVLGTEAVKEYFKGIDWYGDLKRTIDMEPDGREENGFEYYEYIWEKDGSSLRMEFERKGRGLRLIETEDYFIAANLTEQDLVFGQKYKVSYEIKNKSGKILNISIKGVDNKNIKFNFQASKEIKEKEIIQGEFYIGEFSEEPNIFRTHPVVAAEIYINGKRAEFKLGIVPKLPAELSLVGTDAITYNCNPECYKNIEAKIYLDIENSFVDKACFKFQLISNENIEFLNPDIQIEMMEKEKRSLEVSYILKKHCFYSETILVNALLKNGTKLEFKKTLTSLFKGRDGAFGGEGKDCFIITNGAYSAKLNKLNNKIYLRAYENEDEKIFFNIPKLGKPYNSEFSSIKAKEVIWYKEEEWMVLKATYSSQVFANLEIVCVVKVAANGLVEHYHEIHNNSVTETCHDMYILQGNYHSMGNGVIPINNKYVNIKSSDLQAINNFNLDKLTENWFFSQTAALAKGLWWNNKLKPQMDDWLVSFEHKLGDISPGQTVIIPSIKAALNTFTNWKGFRDYVFGEKCSKNVNEIEDLEISINKGNPFVKESFAVEIIEHKNQYLKGNFQVSSEVMEALNLNKTVSEEEEIKSTEIVIKTKENMDLDILKIEADLNLTISNKRNAFFVVKNSEMKKEIIEEEGRRVYCFDNGTINIKACPSFSPALYSMVYKKHEWLDTSYPTPRSKSWFNPWVGGILNAPESLSLRSILEEKIEAEFTVLRDSCGNVWEGIKTSYSIKHNNEYKGLMLKEYFLTLPGVPVLCHVSKVVQNMSKFMNEEAFENYGFFSLEEEIRNNYLVIKNKNEKYVKYKSGKESADISINGSILLGGKNFKEKLQVYANSQRVKSTGFVSIHDTAIIVSEKITLAHGKEEFTAPVFYIFTNEFIEDKLLADLRNIYFE